MKKLLLGLLLLSTPAYAGTISISPWISGNDVSIAHLESQRTTIQNWANGNVEGGTNIKAGSLVSQDFATSVSLVKYRDEAFNDFTYTGHLPVTDATLTSNISAGTSYVNGVRIETSSQSHTYTASKDTYVYINAGGFFDFQEVANGASAPSTPANDLLLAKVVTSGTAITSVTDLRTTSIQITSNNSNFANDFRSGAFVSIDSTTTAHVEPGQVAIGSAYYTNIADTSTKSVATGTNWIEGSAPNIKNLRFYAYAFNNSGTAFDFKYSSADPVYSDTSLNTAGTLRYYTTGGTTYRALAWISGDTSSTISGSAMGQIKDTSNINKVCSYRSDTTTNTSTLPQDNSIPLSNEGTEFFAIPFRLTNPSHSVKIDYEMNLASGASTLPTVALFKDAATNAFFAQTTQLTNVDRVMNMKDTVYTTLPNTTLTIFRLRAGFHDAGTTTFNGASGAALMGGVIASHMCVEEVEG